MFTIFGLFIMWMDRTGRPDTLDMPSLEQIWRLSRHSPDTNMPDQSNLNGLTLRCFDRFWQLMRSRSGCLNHDVGREHGHCLQQVNNNMLDQGQTEFAQSLI